MAVITSNQEAMLSFINKAIAGLRTYHHEMVVVPMVIADTPEKASALLLDVKAFDPRVPADALPANAIGKVRIGQTRTIHDALEELESLTMVGVAELSMAMRCLVSEHIKGLTRKIQLKGLGEFVISLRQFAQLSGLPMSCSNMQEYSVFIHEVADKQHLCDKTMLVLVKGVTDISNGNSGTPTSLQSMMARLEFRANSGHEPGASFHARDLKNAWQLYNNAQFKDLLGWWKQGYCHTVDNDENEGLNISY